MNSPQGEKYSDLMSESYRTILDKLINTCQGRNPQEGFKIYMKISAKGLVSDYFANPISPQSSCFAEGLSRHRWPEPPYAPIVQYFESFSGGIDMQY